MSKTHNKARIGTQVIDEIVLNAEIARVKSEIEAWGRQNELWHEESFATPYLAFSATIRRVLSRRGRPDFWALDVFCEWVSRDM